MFSVQPRRPPAKQVGVLLSECSRDPHPGLVLTQLPTQSCRGACRQSAPPEPALGCHCGFPGRDGPCLLSHRRPEATTGSPRSPWVHAHGRGPQPQGHHPRAGPGRSRPDKTHQPFGFSQRLAFQNKGAWFCVPSGEPDTDSGRWGPPLCQPLTHLGDHCPHLQERPPLTRLRVSPGRPRKALIHRPRVWSLESLLFETRGRLWGVSKSTPPCTRAPCHRVVYSQQTSAPHRSGG